MEFNVKVKNKENGSLLPISWNSSEFQDLEKLLDRLVKEIGDLSFDFSDDWEVLPGEGGLFWVKSPVEALHSGEKGEWLDPFSSGEKAVRDWLAASQVVFIAASRGLDPALVLWFAFCCVGVKNPVQLAQQINLEKEIEEWLKYVED